MQVFISWSGKTSMLLATALHDWLPTVVQSAQPYVSTEDIEKGARWSIELFEKLEESQFGIVCITPDNVSAPWLNFEAGALSKSLSEGRVSPFLLGVKSSDISGPLTQFQTTSYERQDVLRLVQTINAASDQSLDHSIIEKVFANMWAELTSSVDAILRKQAEAGETPRRLTRSDRDVLDEVLENVRLLIRNASMRPAAVGGPATHSRAFLDDSVMASLVDIWLASFSATEADSLSADERAAACNEWMTLLAAPILKIVRDNGPDAIGKYERLVEPVYWRLVSADSGAFKYIDASNWGGFLRMH